MLIDLETASHDQIANFAMAGTLLHGVSAKLEGLYLMRRPKAGATQFARCWRARIHLIDKLGIDMGTWLGSRQPKHRAEHARMEMMAECLDRIRERSDFSAWHLESWKLSAYQYAAIYTQLRTIDFPAKPDIWDE